MMSDDHRFDLASAVHAGADGRLHEWVGEFLSAPGSDNEVLAAALAQRELWYLGPIRFRLADLTPMAGPDEDEVVVPIDPDEWEDDIGDMADALDRGWEPPPLLVSSRDDEFFLEDGNHRHETMQRAGETHGWAIVWFESADRRARFAAQIDDARLPDEPQLAAEALDQLEDIAAAAD